jgi:hypothetical protein
MQIKNDLLVTSPFETVKAIISESLASSNVLATPVVRRGEGEFNIVESFLESHPWQ